jgi:hypothetical protein
VPGYEELLTEYERFLLTIGAFHRQRLLSSITRPALPLDISAGYNPGMTRRGPLRPSRARPELGAPGSGM